MGVQEIKPRLAAARPIAGSCTRFDGRKNAFTVVFGGKADIEIAPLHSHVRYWPRADIMVMRCKYLLLTQSGHPWVGHPDECAVTS